MKKRPAHTAGILLMLLCNSLFSQVQLDPSKGYILENEHARYVFEPVGFGLSAMIDLQTGFNHLAPSESPGLLWEVVFGKGLMRPAIDNNYKACTFASTTKKASGDQVLVLEWNDLRFWEEDSIVSVKVSIELPFDQGIARWEISVSNRSDYWGLWEVACPAIKGFPADGKI